MLTPVDPPQPPPDERPQSPQLALRVAVLGGIAVLLFSVLFFRLWVLQVLSVQEFQAQATENRERTVEVPAPRGMILDRKGRPLVRNRPGDRVTFDLSQDRELAEACGIRPYSAMDNRPEETITRPPQQGDQAGPRGAAEEGAEAADEAHQGRPQRRAGARVGGLRPVERRARAAGAADEDAARRLRGRDPLRPHPLALRAGDAADGRAARARLLPQGARPQLPGRAHPARLRALLPEPGGRRPPLRRAGPDLRRAARGPGGLSRRRGGRHGRHRRRRAHLRPLPARPRRRAAPARRRAGQPGGARSSSRSRPSPARTSG